MDESLSIFTSVLDYTLDNGALNTRYRLLVSPKLLKADYARFYAELRKLAVISVVKSKGRYLILVSSEANVAKIQTEGYWQIVPFDQSRSFDVYDNQILGLLINRLSDEEGNNIMPYHVMSVESWHKKNGQRYGVKFFVDFENNLSVSVVTFSPVKKIETKTIYYYWDDEHQRMQRSLDNKAVQLFEWKNRSSAKNTINFLDTQDFKQFKESKVGLAHQLLADLRKNDPELFIKMPALKQFKLQSYSKREDNGISGVLWFAIRDATINVYYQQNNEAARDIALTLVTLLGNDSLIQQNNIKVVSSTEQMSTPM